MDCPMWMKTVWPNLRLKQPSTINTKHGVSPSPACPVTLHPSNPALTQTIHFTEQILTSERSIIENNFLLLLHQPTLLARKQLWFSPWECKHGLMWSDEFTASIFVKIILLDVEPLTLVSPLSDDEVVGFLSWNMKPNFRIFGQNLHCCWWLYVWKIKCGCARGSTLYVSLILFIVPQTECWLTPSTNICLLLISKDSFIETFPGQFRTETLFIPMIQFSKLNQ